VARPCAMPGFTEIQAKTLVPWQTDRESTGTAPCSKCRRPLSECLCAAGELSHELARYRRRCGGHWGDYWLMDAAHEPYRLYEEVTMRGEPCRVGK
jgi:hypothetical protein